MPAGCCCSSPRRRAFFTLFHRRSDSFEGGVEEFVSVYPLVAVVARLAGVHFECRFTAVVIVLTME